MWIYVMKDKGLRQLPCITNKDFEFVLSEYNQYYEQIAGYHQLTKRIDGFIRQQTSYLPWVNPGDFKKVDKDHFYKFTFLLLRLFELRLERVGLLEKYTFLRQLKYRPADERALFAYFERWDKPGTFLAFVLDKQITFKSSYLTSGYPLLRLVLAPAGTVFRANKLTTLLWSAIYGWLSLIDWAILGIPYYVQWQFSGLPQTYFDSERLLMKYMTGNSRMAKHYLRKLVNNDLEHNQAYLAVLYAVFIREKFVEILVNNQTSV